LVEAEGKKTAAFIGLTSDTDLDERLAFPGNDIYERFEIDLRDELKRFPLTGI